MSGHGSFSAIGSGMKVPQPFDLPKIEELQPGKDGGPHVSMYSANHSLDAAERIAGALIPEPITVGNRVWIGGGSTILSGVTIGDDVVIGAGSVVTRDIPPGVVAAGNPCRVLRKITEEDKVGFPI